MRTTITFPDDLQRRLEALAKDHNTSVNREVNRLVAEALQPSHSDLRYLGKHPVTGFPQFSVGHPVTTEDVRSLEDEE